MRRSVSAALAFIMVVPLLVAAPAAAVETPYRVNAGGPALSGTPSWSADTQANPSPYVNAAATGNRTHSTTQAIDMSHPSLPAGTPQALLQTERWDPPGGAEMEWSFPVTPGTYEVRLYFADIYPGTHSPGARVFDVTIEGTKVLSTYDIFADVGGYKAVMKSFTVSSDSSLDILFGHVVENPKVNAIEILPSGGEANQLGASPSSLSFGSVVVDATSTKSVQLTNLGTAGHPSITVTSTTIGADFSGDPADFTDTFPDGTGVTLAPGQSTTFNVSFQPSSTGSKTATLGVGHSGSNSPIAIPLQGEGVTGTGPGTWQPLPPSGPNRQEVSYVHLGGKLYLAGGSTAHEVYDPVTQTWSTLAPLPQNIDHIQGVAVGGKIYYIGGLAAWPGPHVSTVHIYDPATNTFSQGAPMPRGRGAGGVAVHQGKIYYAGGLASGTVVSWFDVYDPAANTWSQLPNMPVARDHFHAAVVGGKFYVTGGRALDIDATITSTVAFDFSTGAWQTGLAPIPTARGGFASGVLGSEIVVMGGEGGGTTFATVEAYNTITNTWRTLAPMPTARHGIQAAECNGGLYVAAGGKTQGGGSPSDVHEAFFLGSPTSCEPTQQPPSAPTGVSAIAASSNAIDVSWNDVATETSYRIERSSDGSTGWTSVGSTGQNVTTFRDSGLTASTTYFYRVVATNAAGDSPPSATVTATTLSEADTVPPTAPDRLKANGAKQKVNLSWSASTDSGGSGLAGYEVCRSTASAGPFSKIAGVPASTTSLTDDNVTSGVTYWYYVVAVDGAGNVSSPSPMATATPK